MLDLRNGELQRKVDRALKLIQAAGKAAKEHGQPLEICYSGGKDSDVILELARMSGVDYRAIYKNTTIDPPGTIKHALDNGVEVMLPKKTFLELISKSGYPSRQTRFCCRHLKEYKVLDYAVIGVRRDESPKRAERYVEPEQCRVYSKNVKSRQYMPILEWTAQDVSDFISDRGVVCHPLYYDDSGCFHVERRLGCIGCPLAYKKHREKEFLRYPGFVKLYLRGGQRFWDSHPDSGQRKYFKDVYEWFTMQLYCDTMAEFKAKFGPTMFDGGIDCKRFLEERFGIRL